MGPRIDETDLAVLDVETTGLWPQRHDRVSEIAVVRLRAGGRLTEKYVTLLNPGRDLGPTQIHGITARDIIDAPQFGRHCRRCPRTPSECRRGGAQRSIRHGYSNRRMSADRSTTARLSDAVHSPLVVDAHR